MVTSIKTPLARIFLMQQFSLLFLTMMAAAYFAQFHLVVLFGVLPIVLAVMQRWWYLDTMFVLQAGFWLLWLRLNDAAFELLIFTTLMILLQGLSLHWWHKLQMFRLTKWFGFSKMLAANVFVLSIIAAIVYVLNQQVLGMSLNYAPLIFVVMALLAMTQLKYLLRHSRNVR